MAEAKSVAKTVLLTGATGVIGTSIARGVLQRGHSLVFLARSKDKADKLVQSLKTATKSNKISYHQVDLSSKSDMQRFVEDFKKAHSKLDVLINNAAVSTATRETNSAGLELQFAVNIYSYYYLATHLHPLLKAAAPSRIVNVASNYAGELDLTDLQFETREYQPNAVYRQTKQANRMTAWALAEKFQPDNIAVVACHPGVVTSPLLQSLGMASGFDSAEDGAATPLFCAFDSSIDIRKTGTYWHNSKEKACDFSTDKKSIDKLYTYLSSL